MTQIDQVNNRILRIIRAETFDNLVLVQCGRYI